MALIQTLLASLAVAAAPFLAFGLSAAESTSDLERYPHSKLVAVPFHRVKIHDEFWLPRIRLLQTATLPDLLDLAETQGKIDNFRIVGGSKSDGKIRLYNAPDSDVYKLVEAGAYSLAVVPDASLEARMDAVIELIVAAQQPNGYLNTQYTLPFEHPASPDKEAKHVKTFGYGPSDRWNSRAENWPRGYSQLYCAGHLFEAAVAYRAATGKKRLFDVAVRLADHIDKVFDDSKLKGYADHPEVEIGLMRLFEATNEPRYLRLADRIVRSVDFGRPPDIGDGRSRKPLTEQREAFGHCVRTAYVYNGATDVLRASGADDLRTAVDSLWQTIFEHKVYVHGGTGNGTRAEQHGLRDDLPIDGLYCESCASIAQGQWNHGLNLLHGDARYADVVEWELYNSGLSGLSLDGRKYFYTNLLNVGTTGRHDQHSGVRSRYLFCCPSKLPGFLAGIGRWIYSFDRSGINVNQFIDSETTVSIGDSTVDIRLDTELPWEGKSTIRIDSNEPAEFALRIRVPGWMHRRGPLPSGLYEFVDSQVLPWSIRVNGAAVDASLHDGYVVVRRTWIKGDRVEVEFPLSVRPARPTERNRSQQGYVALTRGPLVYCLEGIDNDFDVLRAVVDVNQEVRTERRDDLLGGTITLTGTCTVDDATKSFTAVPYFAWQNRGVHALATMLITDAAHVNRGRVPLDPNNPATSAIVGHSIPKIESHKTLGVHDGIVPTRSADKKVERTTWWPHKGTSEWIEYTFSRPRTIQSVFVFWFQDHPNGGCKVPASWRLLWKNGDHWQPVETQDEFGTAIDRFNRVRFKPITTESLRLEVQLEDGFSAGVLEWKVEPEKNTDG